jgi:hypothetical protein
MIVVYDNDVVPKIREASACHQPDISGTHDRNPHYPHLLRKD